ncbi:MAG: hypothetical protein HQM08_19590 [Candidatus Riflebacteria bacterium]|nr:hypothetical protein [Candidatus Riflebacteria bacterium]
MNRISVYFLLLIVLVVSLFLNKSSAVGESEKGHMATVKHGNLMEKSVYYGEVMAKKTVDIYIPSFDNYYVTVKDVLEDGANVKKGDPILWIDDSDFQKALDSAENDYNLAFADQDKTEFDLKNEKIDLELDVERKKLELEKAKVNVVEDSMVISQIDLKKSKLAVELSQLELQQANNALKEFEKKREVSMKVKELRVLETKKLVELQKSNIGKAIIEAPKDGIIFKPFVRLNNEKGRVEKGKVVSPGDKMLEIPDLTGFQGELYLSPSDNRFVSVGDNASVYLSILPEKGLKASVLSKELYAMSRNERLGRNDPEGFLKEYKTVIDILDNDSVLRPGLTFKVEIESVIATDCLFIPRAAISNDDEKGAYVKTPLPSGDEKKFVKTGRFGISYIEILSGLKENESLLLQ